MYNIFRYFLSISFYITFSLSSYSQKAWVSSNGSYFTEKDLPTVKPSNGAVIIDESQTFQILDGFGGSFNELGYIALQNTPLAEQNKVMEALFGENGLRFNYCRMPIGANDFAREWYSYNQVPDDFDMEHFNISRDTLFQVPYIKKALALKPNLRIWASPWSPPIWMKHNRHYGGRATNMNWGELYGNNMDEIYENNRFVMTSDYLKAYALYFSRFISAYKELGIDINAVQPQNEVFANQLFPSCVWSPENLANFTSEYLMPQLKTDHPEVEVWLGTLNYNNVEYVAKFLETAPNVKGIGVQWDGISMLDSLQLLYPDYKYMQTESECNNGLNEWFTAEHTFDLLYRSFMGGASTYIYWNMILNDLGLSTWMWRQNSLVSVNRFSGKVTYNPEYYVMKHFSGFLELKAKRISISKLPESIKGLAFLNPNGEKVAILHNTSDEDRTLELRVTKQKAFKLEIKAHTMVTFVCYQS